MKSLNALENLIMYSKQLNLSIALVSEPVTTHGRIIERKHFKTIQFECSTYGPRNKAAMLIFNYSLIKTNIETYISSNIEKNVIKTSLDVITFISAYVEPNYDLK